MGTYNYSPSTGGQTIFENAEYKLGHLLKDVNPYYFLKNTKADLHDEYIKHLNQFKKEYEIRKN